MKVRNGGDGGSKGSDTFTEDRQRVPLTGPLLPTPLPGSIPFG